MSQTDKINALTDQHHKMNYVEIAAKDLAATKRYF